MADAPDEFIELNGMGGFVCSVCGVPVESEPCEIHQPDAYARCTDKPKWQRYPVPLTERVEGCVVCENVRGVPIPLSEFAPTDDLALCGRHWAWWVSRFAQGGTPPCSAHLLGTDRENGSER